MGDTKNRKKKDRGFTGADTIAKALASQGVKHVFGIVGVPVIEVAAAMQHHGIQFLGFRNEQSASYAAGVYGYMTGRPGVCLVVSGPGVVHALSGLANAKENCWPLLVLGGASDQSLNSRGAFQESPQVEFARQFTKYAAEFDSIERIPFYIEKAIRTSISGRPGPVYLDIPGNFVNSKVEDSLIVYPPMVPPPPLSLADPAEVKKAVEALKTAKNPLIIVGKGCAYGNASEEITALVEGTGIPFLPTPMGKGVIPDDHPQCVAAARSTALKSADVVVLLCARLNWILHFGLPPRFLPGVKIIQVDIAAEEFDNNVPSYARLCGNVKPVVAQLSSELKAANFSKIDSSSSPWYQVLKEKLEKNRASNLEQMNDDSLPMNYYRAFKEIQQVIGKEYRDAIVVSEGANTMDISRSIIENYFPKHRLDAGTYGTMGLGSGFAIAASCVYPKKKVLCIQGDSAFGFGGMEVETACRYMLPIVFIIINNSGISFGIPPSGETREERMVPPTSLLPNSRYERIVEAFGGKGYFVRTPQEIQPALHKALADTMPSIINIEISPFAGRKAQEFGWLTRAETSAHKSNL